MEQNNCQLLPKIWLLAPPLTLISLQLVLNAAFLATGASKRTNAKIVLKAKCLMLIQNSVNCLKEKL